MHVCYLNRIVWERSKEKLESIFWRDVGRTRHTLDTTIFGIDGTGIPPVLRQRRDLNFPDDSGDGANQIARFHRFQDIGLESRAQDTKAILIPGICR